MTTIKIKKQTLNNILDDCARLDAKNQVLRYMLTKLQFAILPAADCCPTCGGNQRHDPACELAALIDPNHAVSYYLETGMLIIDALQLEIEKESIRSRFPGDMA
jgi:hypothetical protein